MLRSTEAQPSVKQISEMLLRHKGKMTGVLLLFVVAALGTTAFMQPAYRSEAKLFVRLGRENAILDATATMGQGPLVALPSSREDEINSVVEILQSQFLFGQIVEAFGPATILGQPVVTPEEQESPAEQNAIAQRADSGPFVEAAIAVPVSTSEVATWQGKLSEFWERIGPGTALPPTEKALRKLKKRFTVFAAKKSNVITIRYDGPNPQTAKAVVAKLVDLYLSQHVSLHRTAHSHDFFAEQTESLRTGLNKMEQMLRALKDETGVASVSERKTILVDRIGKLEDDKLTADSDLAIAEAELASLEERLTVLPETMEVSRMDGLSNKAFEDMRVQLYTLQLKEQQLLSVFKEGAFQVREIRREVAEAKKILEEEEKKHATVTTGKNKAYEETELDLLTHKTTTASLRARAAKLAEQLASARTDMEQLNAHELRITQLERDVDLKDAQFRAYARNMEQARIDQALETNRISNINVVQPATQETKAVWPNKLANLGLGLLIGGFAGLCLALACEYFDQTVKTVDDVEERLGVPALGSIPRNARQTIRNGVKGTHDHPIPQ